MGSKFTHTTNKKGQWWKASFQGGDQWVWKVRVLNRRDCCGQRLKGVKISVGGTECGTINQNTKNGQWYEVKCARPIRGDKIVIEQPRADYLSISGVEAYIATCTSGCGGTAGMRPMTMPSQMKGMTMRSSPMMGGWPGPSKTTTRMMRGGPMMKLGMLMMKKSMIPVFDDWR
jgi:hypothetical protein